MPELYAALKIAGALYLVWLGFTMMRQRDGAAPGAAIAPKTAKRAFFESVLVELLNPKVAIFFIAPVPLGQVIVAAGEAAATGFGVDPFLKPRG